MIALRAVDGLKRRLLWRGLRPVVCGGNMKPALAVAEHDARKAERDQLDVALSEARATMYAAAATAGADYRDVSDGADLSEILAPVHAAHERERDIADRRFALAHVDETRWALPSSAATVHLGIQGARCGYGYVKPAHSIVIDPGRAPSPAAPDALADDAVVALSADSLPLAA